jgi:hypothetical protein
LPKRPDAVAIMPPPFLRLPGGVENPPHAQGMAPCMLTIGAIDRMDSRGFLAFWPCGERTLFSLLLVVALAIPEFSL